jgi:hypothetical protein
MPILIFLFSLLVTSCATTATKVDNSILPVSEESLRARLRPYCQSSNLTQIDGDLWMKIKSKEANGQFKAALLANLKAESLDLEVLNLFGGTEASVHILKDKYTVHRGKLVSGSVIDEGLRTWSGIPLRWALDLFSSQMPCPFLVEGEKKWVFSGNELDGIRIEAKDEQFEFRFKEESQVRYVSNINWKSTVRANQFVQVRFDSPENGYSPAFEIESPSGHVKVKWRSRNTKSN